MSNITKFSNSDFTDMRIISSDKGEKQKLIKNIQYIDERTFLAKSLLTGLFYFPKWLEMAWKTLSS